MGVDACLGGDVTYVCNFVLIASVNECRVRVDWCLTDYGRDLIT